LFIGLLLVVGVHCVIEARFVVGGVDHVATNVHCVVSVHHVCLFSQVLSLLFIVLYSPFVVSATLSLHCHASWSSLEAEG
jgi:hypothetical protein